MNDTVKSEVKIGEWIEKGFNLYKENFSILVLASLITVLLSVITIGILAGPMLAGLILITLKLLDKKEPKPEVGELFKGLDYFLQSFLFVVVWGVAVFIAMFIVGLVPLIGALASIFLSLAAGALLMFGLFLIVDKGMEFWPASQESFNVVKANFWPFLGLSIVAAIIGSIGGIACGIGVVITLPIQYCILAVAYRDVCGGCKKQTASDQA